MAKVTNPTPTYNFGTQQGSDHTETFTVYSEPNVLADLSNWTSHMQWRDSDYNLMLDSETVPGLLTTTANGEVIVFLSGAVTTALAIPDPSDVWNYDIKLTSPGGNHHYTLVCGATTFFRETTQP